MDSFLPQSAKLLLGILASALLLGVVAAALIYVGRVTDSVNRDSEIARYQREYARLRRFDATNIAYTEVLNAIYVESTEDIPVVVTTAAVFNGNPAWFAWPLNVPQLRINFGSNIYTPPFSVGGIPTGLHGVWNGIGFNPGAIGNQSGYKNLSDWLASISRSHSNLMFRGRVLRNDSGVAYAIVFTYTP